MWATKHNQILFLFFLMTCPSINAQKISSHIEQAKALVDDGKYKEAYGIFQNINESQVIECGDSCIMLYNYGKGACLYFMDKYEEAIPFIKKGLAYKENLPHEDCDYLEMFYGIGACYKKLGNYPKAEEYFRKTILKGNDSKLLNCGIRTQTYRDMAELYSLMGKPEFADICISRIGHEMKYISSEDIDSQIGSLYDLYSAYDKQGKTNESINTLKSILSLVEKKQGKLNKDYLSYSSLIGFHLMDAGRDNEAAEIHKEMISIGKDIRSFNNNVYNAYNYYLSYLADKGEIDSIESLLPMAEKYYKSSKTETGIKFNLYETIGIGLFKAQKYEEGVKYLEKKWNGKSANSIRALTYLGNYYDKSDPPKAISYYKEAESQINNGLEVNDDTKSIIYENLMFTNLRIGNSQEAIKYAELLEPLIKKLNNDDYYLTLLHIWAAECIKADYYDKAKELVGKCESLVGSVANDTKISALSQMGFIYLKLDQLDKAIDKASKGIDLAIAEKGNKHPALATLYHNLGRAYMLKDDYSRALSALYKSRDLQIELEGEVGQRTADYIKECESK